MGWQLYSLSSFGAWPSDFSLITVLFTIFVILASVAYVFLRDVKRKRPPGPWGLPFVGFLPYMGNAPHETFAKLVPKYGPVIRLNLGFMDCVVLGTYDAIKEAFVKQSEIFSGRPDYMNIKVYDDETAFVYKEGEKWKDLRKFSVFVLKKLGIGRESLEPVILSEIHYFIEALEEREAANPSHGFPIGSMIQKSISNTMCSVFLGERCDYSDPWLDEVVRVVKELHDTYVHDNSLFFSWMVNVPLLSKLVINPQKRVLKDEMWALWKKKITEFNNRDNLNRENFLSMWSEEYRKRLSKNDSNAEDFSEYSLVSNIDILCQASFETTATTLQWAVLYLLLNPEMQVKLQAEIDGVIGQERMPAFANMADMHYTRAFITETHRKASLLPMGLFHCTRDSTFLMGYWIPKRTIIISNQWAAHHDSNIFPDPERFDPDRFIDGKGHFVRHESIVPFSLGKRSCPGETVAEMGIFLYLTSLLQKYTLAAPPGTNLDNEATFRFLVRPKPYNICLKRR